MIRLLVQFKSEQVFGGAGLELLGIYNDVNVAVEEGLSLYNDTVDCMFINEGNQYLQLR